MNELDRFIVDKCDFLGCLAITDNVDEETLKRICEEYYKLKQKTK